ncbi:D-2-hydroxyacid dehydrogenase [Sphingomonas sp. MAH-20]|uniref:D-2-hydroxyacid dehydrogenase n=1 Tax=Sphingomonas horti TaxID=2682842 RepID=A0A6I4J1A7_9SPHN|nr:MULTISPECIES: D-2-hydroxyacid dehydrogenase [Sphingomonas]MBA2919836.1 D-2-hydroxyacid dehydrogenase [Sphingomonas sp. CGMCC 1.13658]MVO78076.1 D-2-hydroxyacid dehydrogenase [Sphingomonas horti]
MILVLPALARPLLAPHLPADVETRWFASAEDAYAMAPGAEVGWLDMQVPRNTGRAIELGESLKLVTTIYAGTDAFPLQRMKARGTRLTNGSGINTNAVAEYAVMGMLALAKNYAEVVRAADRHEWLLDAPGKVELQDSRALIIGYGAIGGRIGEILRGFGVHVTGVRRSPAGEPDMLGPNDWRGRLGAFDWVIVAAPSTAETAHLLGPAELAAMKPSAYLVNIARGTLIDQDALIEALRSRRIAGAHLDVTDPESLPADHPLWEAPNAVITMHLSGRAQTRMFQRAAALFLDNLARYRAGEPLINEVDLDLGY